MGTGASRTFLQRAEPRGCSAQWVPAGAGIAPAVTPGEGGGPRPGRRGKEPVLTQALPGSWKTLTRSGAGSRKPGPAYVSWGFSAETVLPWEWGLHPDPSPGHAAGNSPRKGSVRVQDAPRNVPARAEAHGITHWGTGDSIHDTNWSELSSGSIPGGCALTLSRAISNE